MQQQIAHDCVWRKKRFGGSKNPTRFLQSQHARFHHHQL